MIFTAKDISPFQLDYFIQINFLSNSLPLFIILYNYSQTSKMFLIVYLFYFLTSFDPNFLKQTYLFLSANNNLSDFMNSNGFSRKEANVFDKNQKKISIKRIQRLANPQTDFFSISPSIQTIHYSQIKKNKQEKQQQNSQICTQIYKEKIQYLFSYLFKEGATHLYKNGQSLFNEQWVNIKERVCIRLNKIIYLQKSLKFMQYRQIEKEMLHEWKKNHLLYGIQFLFNQILKTHKFDNKNELKTFYNVFRSFVSQALYSTFGRCLQILQSKEQNILSKLQNETAVQLITSSREWKDIYENHLQIHILKEFFSLPERFNIFGLEISHRILNLIDDKDQFLKTKANLEHFATQYRFLEKIRLLKEYRINLLAQIEQNIENNSSKCERIQHLTVQKEDILTCLVYCMIRYRMNGIGKALLYLRFILGEQIYSTLSKWKCDSYMVDLQAAFQYLSKLVPELELQKSSNKTIETEESSQKLIEY